MSKIRYLIMICLVLSCVATVSCAKKEAPKPEEPQKEAPQTPESKDGMQHKVLSFNLEGFTEKGTKSWEVTGKSAEAVSEKEIKLNNIVAKSFGKDAEATIVADEGVYDKGQNNVRLQKNVRAVIDNPQGMAGGFVDLPADATTPDKKEKKDKGKTVITCDGEVIFDYEKNYAFFVNNVKIVSPDGTIDADKITVNLEPETKKVHDIVADGNVVIVRGENIIYSEKATYVEADKKVILTGKPKLVISQEGELKNNLLGK